MNTISKRRRAYLKRFLQSTNITAMESYDRRLWAINHARLLLNRDVKEANHYFETVELDPRTVTWKDGKVDTADWDFLGMKLLKTVLDFEQSPQLSDKARAYLKAFFINWQQPRPSVNKDNNCVARWPTIHTENHDLMCLTIGLFGEAFAGRDTREHVAQLARSLSWRFERGWVEWSSPCYQVHYLNPLLILQQHAPSAALRKGASDLIDLQLAERALLSSNGYLGGPFFRGYDQHFADDRCDSYLPIMWLAFGLTEEPTDEQMQQGIEFAADVFEPDPKVSALAAEAQTRPVLLYKGLRWTDRVIRYYNTPHISMGSMQAFSYSFQTRFFNVMFSGVPSKSIRTCLQEQEHRSPWDQRNERGELVQYKNWLLSRGTLVEEGGLLAEQAGGWRLYSEGKGLCAHQELSGDLHVFQVSDLEQFADKRSFLESLHEPTIADGKVNGKTLDGEDVCVDLTNMSLLVNGSPFENTTDMLHDCKEMSSRYGTGRIEISTEEGDLVLENSALRPILPATE